MTPQNKIQQAFREVLDAMNLIPLEATKGPCRIVAERVDERVDRDLRILSSADVTDRTDQWHEWLFDPATGRHHDAEAPRGVEDWNDLPFFGGWRIDRSRPPEDRGDSSPPVGDDREGRSTRSGRTPPEEGPPGESPSGESPFA